MTASASPLSCCLDCSPAAAGENVQALQIKSDVYPNENGHVEGAYAWPGNSGKEESSEDADNQGKPKENEGEPQDNEGAVPHAKKKAVVCEIRGAVLQEGALHAVVCEVCGAVHAAEKAIQSTEYAVEAEARALVGSIRERPEFAERKRMSKEQLKQHLNFDELPYEIPRQIKKLFDSADNDVDLHALVTGTQEYRRQKKLLIGLLLVALLCIPCVFASGISASRIAKDSHIEQGVMRSASTGDIISTGALHNFVSLMDLPGLPVSSLEQLEQVTLVQQMGDVQVHHNYKVAGFQLHEDTGELHRRTDIRGTSVHFRGGAVELARKGRPSEQPCTVEQTSSCIGYGIFNSLGVTA